MLHESGHIKLVDFGLTKARRAGAGAVAVGGKEAHMRCCVGVSLVRALVFLPASQSVAAAGSLPRTSSFVGTPPYMAPEALARGIKNDHEWILADWW